jgi:NAD(P)-dependent dehydrogenase (short-subunit alcohol dehydrogenase family)
MREFKGKTAVVTGAASGIGRGLATRFAQAGMQVVLSDIEEGALKQAVGELEQQGHRVLGLVTDTMRRESLEELRRRALEAFGKVHVLCNNAGVASRGEARGIWEIADADWQWVMGVNFWGVLYGLQVFVPHMLEHGEEGHIVNTASLAAVLPGGGVYGVSKHGVLALSEGLHRNLKERDARIGASVLCPGFVNTRIFDAERNRPRELKSDAPEIPNEAMAAGAAMLAQGKQPAEIAEQVLESIREDRFYILPHPAWDPYVRARVEQILERKAPFTMDFQDMMRRRAAGEQF